MTRTDATQNAVVQVPNLPANFMQRFVFASDHFVYRNPDNGDQRGEQEEEEAEIELTLGLSLHGRLGTDSRVKKGKYDKLARSSSIPDGFTGGESLSLVTARVSDTFELTRTRSLPVETEELQRLRRMGTKRRRSERTRAYGGFNAPHRDGECNDDDSDVNYGVNRRFSGIDGGQRRNAYFGPACYPEGRWCGVEIRCERGNVVWSIARGRWTS